MILVYPEEVFYVACKGMVFTVDFTKNNLEALLKDGRLNVGACILVMGRPWEVLAIERHAHLTAPPRMSQYGAFVCREWREGDADSGG